MAKNLLLADDSVTIQKVVGITFAGEDFKIVSVDNGEDAIARARELRPDVVLADVVMPRRNGYEVCEAIKADPALQHIPVLLLAGTFESFDEARARAARADGHIAKPFESQALINKVKELVGSAVPVAATTAAAPASQPAAAQQPAPCRVPPPAQAARPMPGAKPVPAAPRSPPPSAPAWPAAARPGMPPAGRPPMGMPPGLRPPPAGMPPVARPPTRPPPGVQPPAPGALASTAPQGQVPFGSRPPADRPLGVRPPFGGAPPMGAALPLGMSAAPAAPIAVRHSPAAIAPPLAAIAPAPVIAPPPAAIAPPPSQPLEDDWSDLDLSDVPSEPVREVPRPSAAAPSAPGPVPPAPSAVASPAPAPSAMAIPAAEVIALDDLDFGEPSAFAAPPRPAVERAPEPPEPIDLPMLEAEDEIELSPSADLAASTDEAPRSEIAEKAPPAPPPAEVASVLTLAPSEPEEMSPPEPLPAEPAIPLEAIAFPAGEEASFLETRAPAPATSSLPSLPPPREREGVMPAAVGDGGEAQLREALSHASREVIERIAWEVVPQLAEVIIREQLDRLVKERQP